MHSVRVVVLRIAQQFVSARGQCDGDPADGTGPDSVSGAVGAAGGGLAAACGFVDLAVRTGNPLPSFGGSRCSSVSAGSSHWSPPSGSPTNESSGQRPPSRDPRGGCWSPPEINPCEPGSREAFAGMSNQFFIRLRTTSGPRSCANAVFTKQPVLVRDRMTAQQTLDVRLVPPRLPLVRRPNGIPHRHRVYTSSASQTPQCRSTRPSKGG
jgi:hypothetical protein